jgi:hypothetical protein
MTAVVRTIRVAVPIRSLLEHYFGAEIQSAP